MTRVFIIAASPIVRSGLETLIGGDARFTVIGSASEKMPEIEELSPDVLVMDLERQTEDALAAMFIPAAAEENRQSYAIVLLAPNARVSEWTLDALRSGVRAVLPTMATENEILAAIEAAAAGLVVLQTQDLDVLLSMSPSLDAAAATELAPRSSGQALRAATVEALTPREAEILGMLGEGLGNKTIAYRLGISDHTVKFHVASIFGKLGVSSRTEAVTQGLRLGLILL